MRRILWCAALFLVPGVAVAESKTFELTVSAGKHDRTQVPVRVPLRLLITFAAEAKSVILQDADGKQILGQLTQPGLIEVPREQDAGTIHWHGDLHFILPSLKAGKSMALKCTISTDAPAKAETFSWHDTKGEYAELRFGDRPVLRYLYKALDESSKEKRDLTYKVYHHLFDPSGKRLVTNGSTGKLYPHHRGLFYGFKCYHGDGKMADTWHCPAGTHLGHEKFLSSEAGPVLGRHRVEIGWYGPGKELFAREERELTVYNVPGGQLVEFASSLRSTGGTVKVGGDPQHAGFHFRADDEVAQKTKQQTYYVRPDGVGKPGETRNWDPKTKKGPVDLPWNALSFVLGEKRYTVAYLDRPTNPKEARFSERDYGRFGSYFEYELTKEKPLVVNYRIWLQEGEMTVEEVATRSASFVQPVEVMLK